MAETQRKKRKNPLFVQVKPLVGWIIFGAAVAVALGLAFAICIIAVR